MISQEEIEAALEIVERISKDTWANVLAAAVRQARARIVELEAEKKADWFVPAHSEEMALERLKQAEAKSAELAGRVKFLEDELLYISEIECELGHVACCCITESGIRSMAEEALSPEPKGEENE